MDVPSIAPLLPQLASGAAHTHALGFTYESLEGDRVRIRVPWREDLVGDPETGVIHGGAVSALMDTCCGAAAMSHPQLKGVTATIGLRIDYMRPATPRATIRVRAECHHITRSVAFVRAIASDGDETRPVAERVAFAKQQFAVAGPVPAEEE